MLTDPMLWALLLVALLPKRARAAVARHLATASTGAIVAVALGVPLVLGGATGAALGFFGLTIAAAVLLLIRDGDFSKKVLSLEMPITPPPSE